MCFSAEASFISSVALAVGGAVTLSQNRDRRSLPLAAIPLVFSFHQLIEGGLWLAHTHAGPAWLIALLSHAFPFIAYVFWPTFAPYAFGRIEQRTRRKKLLAGCLWSGVAVSSFYLYYLASGPVTAQFINESSIHYEFYFPFFATSQWLYGFAIILAAFFSSHRIVNVFGVGLVVSYNIAKQAYTPTYPSVFCFFAAILSLIIYLQIRYGKLQATP